MSQGWMVFEALCVSAEFIPRALFLRRRRKSFQQRIQPPEKNRSGKELRNLLSLVVLVAAEELVTSIPGEDNLDVRAGNLRN